MKKTLFFTISLFLILNTTFSQVDINQNGTKTTVIGPFSAGATQAKSFEIANIGYNSHHWQMGGSIIIELFQIYYSTDYQRYIIENGYGQGTDNTLPKLKLVEVSGKMQSAKLSLGTPTDLSSSSSGYINKSLSIYLNLKNYAKYRVKITYQQPRVAVLSSLNEIKINETATGIDIPDFSVSTELDNNLITNGNLRVNGAGNHYVLNGNVGIGTINPGSKLTVAGNITSREVKVTVDAGADFVFEKDYDLPSLESIEKYVKENKHLPEIASAKEMQEEGINLSEMNIKLLQKIEEMTLYMIEMKKENEKQNAIIKNNEIVLKKIIQKNEIK